MTERFLRIMIQLAVQHCLRSEAAAAASMPPGAPRPAPLSFIAVDAAVRLFVCLITQHGGGNSLFVKVLGILASVLQRDVDERGGAFNGRPYYRMCASWGRGRGCTEWLVENLGEVPPGDACFISICLSTMSCLCSIPASHRCVGFLAELSPADPADEAGLQHLQVGAWTGVGWVVCRGRPAGQDSHMPG